MEDGENSYMVGWARRAESASSTQDVAAWGGNIVVQKILQKENGELYLAPVDTVADRFGSEGPFGLAFDFNGKSGKYKMITLDPAEGLLQLSFNEGGTLIAEKAVQLEAGRDYTLFR